MKNLFKFFLLLNILKLTLMVCPDHPTLPTGSIPASSPLVITSASPGISNFPSSTKILSISMVITPDEACPAGSTYNLFSLSVGGPTPKSLLISIVCDTLEIYRSGSLLLASSVLPNKYSGSGSVAIFFSFHLGQPQVKGAVLGPSLDIFALQLSDSSLSFDTDSKFYLCSNNGAGARACTVSEFIFEYRYYAENGFTYAHFAGTNPAVAALYPLADGSLANPMNSATPAYFGDKPLSPTPGTSPTWDPSNNLITMSAGQFLTIPLPPLSSTIPTISTSFSVAAWVKITNIGSTKPSIFALHSADGTQVGYEMKVLQSTKGVSMSFDNIAFTTDGPALTLTLNAWQLVGFTAYISANKKTTEGTFFVGTSWAQFFSINLPYELDLSTASVIRIGDATNSISGSVSATRIMTPGGGIVRTTNICSSDNSIELGVGSFSLSCSGGNVINLIESKCYATCPTGTRQIASFCVPCPKSHCETCTSTQCLTCPASYFLNEGDCVKPCPDGTYSDDGTTCQTCPMSCSKCSASMTCQACNSGYVLSNSFCYTPSLPSPSPSKTAATAVETIASAAQAVGSVVSVGSSVFPVVGLVSEVVQNTRYLNLSVTDELAQIYKTFSTDMISWDLPNFLSEVEDFKPLSELFARYDLDSSFLVNFWSTMMTVGVSLCVLIVCLVIQKSCFEKGNSRGGGLVYSLIQKILAGSINFIIVQAYGCLDNILFYFVLDIKTNPFDNAFPRVSFAFGIIFVICGVSLMIFSIRIVQKYHVLKREGLAKSNMKNLETHKNKNKYWETFYGDFNDASPWSHCFLGFLVLKSNLSSLILTTLYDHPLMQAILLIILDGALITFMLIEKPFTTLRGVFFQYYFEIIALIVHICCFILSWSDGPSEGLKKKISTAIIYLNTALVTGGLCFMSIDIHEIVRDKINEWKLKRAQKKTSIAEESGISLQNDSSIVETKPPIRIMQAKNLVNPSSLLSKFQLNNNNNNNNNFQHPQIRISRKKRRFEFINQDMNLP